MAKGVAAVGTAVLVFVAFGELVMFYWQLRLLNRSTNGTRRSRNGRRYERACGGALRMDGEAAADAGWSRRFAGEGGTATAHRRSGAETASGGPRRAAWDS